ncbi:type-1 restriction enzyme EcoKI specificity protein [mine drainage metagenome]|uniref:Type-1 restriction enzyme EcoKI specificity protein n=1 Tax=mine drainage metagenome TaxID=410659 RepID=A0A1J5RKN9_9ZZZZ
MKDQTEDIFEPAMPVVPPGWGVLPFELAIDVISDKSKRVKQREYLPSGKLPVIDQGQDFIGGYTDDENMAFEGELPVILFGDHTRSIKYVNKLFAVGAEGVKILKPSGGFDPKYLYYLLRSLQIPSRGYSRHFQFLRKFHFPRAPEGQQKQIVAEIEKQFSRLDEAVANLKRVKANLKRYKAAVLKAAVEGRLVETEAELARREGRSYETGEQLLQRILETRRSQWQGKGKYKEPTAPDTTDLPELPEGWVWAVVGQTAQIISGLTKNPKREALPNKFPYLRVANVYADELRLDEIEHTGVADNELEKLLLQRNDLLVVEGNGSPDQIGRVALWDGSIPNCVHQNHIIKVRFSGSLFPKWIMNWLLSPSGRSQIEQVSSSTSGLHTLSTGKVSRLPAPIPPLAEQYRIVAEVERRLSLISEVGAQVEANLKRAERLRQSVLSSAFGR